MESGDEKPCALPVNPAGIPDALKVRAQWVAWRYERRKDRAGNWKWTKLPIDPKTGRLAKSTDPSTWGTFQEALDRYRGDALEGVGFVFTEPDPFAGVDLDDCRDRDTGELAPWAVEALADLDSYAEVSPSGTGVKLFVEAKLSGEGNRRGPVEMYDRGRYFAITGARLDGSPPTVEARQAQLDQQHARLVAGKQPRGATGVPGAHATRPPSLDDAALVEKAKRASDGDKFSRLWGGDRGGYDSASEADLALCSKLAFWTGGDRDRINRLFHQSGLMRPKWDERRGQLTYGERTINKALDGRADFYRPRSACGPAPVAQAAGCNGDATNGKADYHLTDLGNARRVVARHGKDLRYCHPWKQWLVYDGRRWAEDATAEAVRRVKETQGALYRWAAEKLNEIGEGDDEERAKQVAQLNALLRHCLKWEDARNVGRCLQLAMSEPGLPILPEQLDADPFLFNCQNGTLDLRTGTLRVHRREDCLTKLCPVEYRADAPCPLWDSFLCRVLADNADLIGYLQRLIGYSLTGHVREQALWFLFGSGANGKSTFLGTILAMLGDYGMQAVSDLLLAKRNESHPTERADLFGRRFVATIEVDEGKRMAEALMKQLTGGDKVRARKMRQDFFEFAPTWKILLAVNHKPTIRGTDHAAWRRIKLVPFTETIPEHEQDKRLPEKLRAELPGILAWAVRGCCDWQRHGLGEPEEVTGATNTYRTEQDTLAGFLAECCLIHPEARVRTSALLDAYSTWSGDKPTPKAFTGRMADKGYASERGTGGYHFFRGVGLPAGASDG
jgi:putative DNA primase/helicase